MRGQAVTAELRTAERGMTADLRAIPAGLTEGPDIPGPEATAELRLAAQEAMHVPPMARTRDVRLSDRERREDLPSDRLRLQEEAGQPVRPDLQRVTVRLLTRRREITVKTAGKIMTATARSAERTASMLSSAPARIRIRNSSTGSRRLFSILSREMNSPRRRKSLPRSRSPRS